MDGRRTDGTAHGILIWRWAGCLVDKQWRCSATDRAQALGSRRSRTPVRLKWREAGQGVAAIFTPTLEPRLFLPKPYLPTSCCQDHQVACKTTSLSPNHRSPSYPRLHVTGTRRPQRPLACYPDSFPLFSGLGCLIARANSMSKCRGLRAGRQQG
jgi:hypothetical protein